MSEEQERKDRLEAAEHGFELAKEAHKCGDPLAMSIAVAGIHWIGMQSLIAAIDRNTAALMQQGEPYPPEQEGEDNNGGFTSLDQTEPGKDP